MNRARPVALSQFFASTVLFVIGASLLAGCPGAFAQAEQPVLHVQVSLQSLAIRVTDKQGNDVKGLSASDFTVLEDGRPQKISFFGTDNVPTSLNVLADVGRSVDTGKLGSAEAIAARFLRSGRPDDEISAMEFSDQMGAFRSLTEQQLRNTSPAVLSPGPSRGSALYDAIATVLCHLSTSKNLRQAIVVISDGVDQHSRLSLEQLIALVQSSRAQLFMIGLNSRPEYDFNGHPETKLTLVSGHEIDNPAVVFDRLTSESGAQSFFPNSEDGLEQALKRVSDLLQAQYTIAYYPEDTDRKFHQIQVKLKRRGLIVTTRRGVGSTIPSSTSDFTRGSCEVSRKAHPYPYESKLAQDGTYHENFSDVRSGWPNRENSRYVPSGYELVNSGPSKIDAQQRSNPFLGGLSVEFQQQVLAAYGPWWTDFHASAVLDEMVSRGSTYTNGIDPKTNNLDQTSAGLVFRLNERGYYALLLNDFHGAKDIYFKLQKRGYQGNTPAEIIPWTPLHLPEAPKSGMKMAVESVGSEITIFLNSQQVARVKDDTYDQGYVGFILSGMGSARFSDLVVAPH